MRSITFTFILAALAALICGVLCWQARNGNLDAIFGVPPVKEGQKLYTGIQPSDIGRISLSAHGVNADFIKTPQGWKSAEAPQDRMDPRHALEIIAFTLNLNVVDFSRADKLDHEEIGLRDDSLQVRLETASGQPLAHYRLGDLTPLLSERKDATVFDATVFVQPRERGRKDYIYACTGDISPLAKEGFRVMRDHRPFYFDPRMLHKVRLRGNQGELTLGHEDPQAAWRIAKPLDLRTDSTVVKTLLEGLYQLEAPKISNRSAITLPGAETAKTQQIGLTSFGSETETLLEVYPAASPDAQEVLATVSDRPDTVFHLPIKSLPGFVSLSDIPMSVNDLRDRALTRVDIASLRAISLSPITGRRILISRQPPKPWQVEIDGVVREANEKRLFGLLKALTEGKAIGFEGDAVTDFSKWGLDRPFLIVELLGENNQTIRLNFGMDGRGGVFMNRQGTPTVLRIDPALIAAFPITATEWRHARLWSVSTVDLVAIDRAVRTDPPLTLFYNFNAESWTGQIDGKDTFERKKIVSGKEVAEQVDVTSMIDPAKANRLLDSLVNLNVTRWLLPTDAAAAAALESPLLSINVSQKTVNDLGDPIGLEGRTLTLAPATGDPNTFYGRLTDEPNPFVLDRETFLKIALAPLEK